MLRVVVRLRYVVLQGSWRWRWDANGIGALMAGFEAVGDSRDQGGLMVDLKEQSKEWHSSIDIQTHRVGCTC